MPNSQNSINPGDYVVHNWLPQEGVVTRTYGAGVFWGDPERGTCYSNVHVTDPADPIDLHSVTVDPAEGQRGSTDD